NSVLLLGLKRVSVRLVDCMKTAGQSGHIIHKTTQTGENPHSSSAELRNETLSGDSPSSHICDHCGKNFTTARSLKLHLQYLKRYRDNLTEEKPHVCSTCAKGFSEAGSLKRHLRTHTGEKPYVCHHCGKGFSQAYSLKIHWRTHTGEKPYVCYQCGKGFTESGTLKRHIRTHTGEKPFHCPRCGKDFIESGGLKKHIKRSIHTGEKPYHFSSDDCGMSFATSREQRLQQRKHTKEKLCSTLHCNLVYHLSNPLSLPTSDSIVTWFTPVQSLIPTHIRLHCNLVYHLSNPL
uniref:Zinc finger protein 345-like n=1 Tax=Salmo trutta TaxID=8032 RepID=A0A674A3I4_SALTR